MLALECTIKTTKVEIKRLLSIYRGGRNQYELQAVFSDEWIDKELFAVFSSDTEAYEMPIFNNICKIPDEILKFDRFTIGFLGISSQQDFTTNLTQIGVAQGTQEGDTPDIPTPSEWEQYVFEISDLYHETKDLVDNFSPLAPETGNGLKLVDNVLSVVTAEVAEKDNTLPISSAAVHTEIGNIDVLLSLI